MSEPSREHVAAVARTFMGGQEPCEGALDDARKVLTSTDPAVLDAMQDALVRAGRLRVERSGVCDDEERTVRLERRVVSEWQEEA